MLGDKIKKKKSLFYTYNLENIVVQSLKNSNLKLEYIMTIPKCIYKENLHLELYTMYHGIHTPNYKSVDINVYKLCI